MGGVKKALKGAGEHLLFYYIFCIVRPVFLLFFFLFFFFSFFEKGGAGRPDLVFCRSPQAAIKRAVERSAPGGERLPAAPGNGLPPSLPPPDEPNFPRAGRKTLEETPNFIPPPRLVSPTRVCCVGVNAAGECVT